jgi:hypothetical protein
MGHKSRKRIAQDYSRNAIFDKKHGYKKEARYEAKQAVKEAAGEGPSMMGQVHKGSMAMGRAGHVGSYTGNNMKLNATALMGESVGQERKNLLTDMPIDDRATPVANLNKGYGYQVGKPSVASRQKYGGNKGDESRSDRDYSAPTKMYGGKKGDMSKSRRDYM